MWFSYSTEMIFTDSLSEIPTCLAFVVSKEKNHNCMKALVLIFALCFLFAGCSEENVSTDSTCSTPATVRDLSGLDGCGWVFELTDGAKLMPFLPRTCGTPPLPEEMTVDPLSNFEYVDGKQVTINYEIMTDMGTACMAGKVVKITCISDRLLQGNE